MEAVVAKRVSGQGHVPGIHSVEVPQERRRTHALPAGARGAGEVSVTEFYRRCGLMTVQGCRAECQQQPAWSLRLGEWFPPPHVVIFAVEFRRSRI